jgi:hypothetical protein
MAKTDLSVKIGAQFVGQKAFKNAEESISRLGKTAARLLIGGSILAFGKKTLDAFAADDKAAKALGKTLVNLGQAFAIPSTAKFIQQLQDTTGILDDELRPAFTTLVNSTLDAKKAQDLLGVALDVSAGTTKDLQTVTVALSKAALGEKGALMKLNVGLNSTQLATMNLSQITDYLTNKFGGQAALAADTYAGKMALLQAKASDAAETIGGALAKALDDVFGDPAKAGSGIDAIASKLSGLIDGVARFIKLTKIGFENPFLSPDSPVFKYKMNFDKPYDPRSSILNVDALSAEEKRRKAEALKLQKEQLRLQAASNKAQKDAALIAKSKGILDVQQANIVAALQGKISDNDKLRLELQLAMLTGNAKEADRLSNELLLSQARTTGLATFIASLPKALNPFADYPAYVQMALAELAKLANAQKMVTFQGITAPMGTPIAYQGGYQTNAPTIINNFAGNLVTDKDWAEYVRLQLINQAGGGNFATLNRNDFRL